ncbi:MAG: glycosyltransferase family 2 protein [Eubacteriales bacterium]|nr:glycosyltransferase family 2 protein [Eubacteriales bacterium]MDD4323689.1 glycosyltransferase family 2 protein [Eubacteriales bacterium]MDD4540941.1 glycosyltransferase family 2 protein [Eubacteriales bacterium]
MISDNHTETTNKETDRPTVSLLIPFYNEEKLIDNTIQTVLPIMDSLELSYEIVCVDDGSQDRSWELLSKLAEDYPQIYALRLSRNFGKEAALSAGLAEVRGDAVITMDGDLQHDPKHIPQMIELWRDGYDVVEGVKSARNDAWLSRLAANAFYKLFKYASGYNLKNASDFKLLDRKVVDAWNRLPEKETFYRALSAWLGFRRTSFEFDVQERKSGKSKWSVLKLFRLSGNALTGFSSKPLQIINVVGWVFILFFLILAIQTLINYFQGQAVEGFTTVILLQLLIGGGIFLGMGVMGTYIDRIFIEVKRRPRYLISERKGRDEND